MHHLVKKKCTTEDTVLCFTHENWDKPDEFGHIIYTSKDAIEGPTERQVSNKVHGPYGKVTSGVINWLQQTSRSRDHILLPLASMTPTNESRDILQETMPPNVVEQGR